MRDHLPFGVGDHRVPVIAEGDGLLQRHQIAGAHDAQGGAAVGQRLHQIEDRVVFRVVVEVGHQRFGRTGARQSAQFAEQPIGDRLRFGIREPAHPAFDAAVGCQNAEMHDLQRRQQIGQPVDRGFDRAAFDRHTEDRFQVLHVARHGGGQVAGDQQMAFADRVELILEGRASFPHGQNPDWRRGDQREGDEQQMMHTQGETPPAARCCWRGLLGFCAHVRSALAVPRLRRSIVFIPCGKPSDRLGPRG